MMNPIAIDYTLIVQMILFSSFGLLILFFVYKFISSRQNSIKQSEKLDRIIELLEDKKKD